MAKQLMPRNGLRPATCHAVFGLLASSGLRISEALNLSRSDFDPRSNLLQIRKAKLHKDRIVPIHPSVTEELLSYEKIRDCIIRKPSSEYFFLFDNGSPANQRVINHALRSICGKLVSEVLVTRFQKSLSPAWRLIDTRCGVN